MPSSRTIVVFVHQAMGDCAIAIPLLRMCEASMGPQDRLILVTRFQSVVQLLRALPWKANVELWNMQGSGWKKIFSSLLFSLRLRKLKPDILLAPMTADRVSNALAFRFIGAKQSIAIGPKWLETLGNCRAPKLPHKTHRVEECIAIGELAGIPRKGLPEKTIELSREQLEKGRQNLPWFRSDRRWVIFAPGSAFMRLQKRYPIPNFRSVAKLLLAKYHDMHIAVLGSEDERGLIQSFFDSPDFDANRCAAAIGINMNDMLALIGGSQCLVSGCSGSSHVAAAMGTPVVGIYGPTNPGLTGAYSKYFRMVRLGLKCSPCWRFGFSYGCGNPICMSMIPPESVFEAIVATLENKPYPSIPWCETTDACEAIYPTTTAQTKAAA
jgi:ADP-heptose:LPS heptosyltransferase